MKILEFVSSPPWCGLIIGSYYARNTKETEVLELSHCKPGPPWRDVLKLIYQAHDAGLGQGLGQGFCNTLRCRK